MKRRLFLVFALVLGALTPAQAKVPVAMPVMMPVVVTAKTADLGTLVDAMRLSDMLHVMRAEGIAHGAAIEQDLFPGRGGASWNDAVERIFDPDTFDAQMTQALAVALDGVDLTPLIRFYETEPGREIVGREIDAREALLDETTEEASLQRLDQMRATGDPRLTLIKTFVKANGMVEHNVMGAMNSNLAFLNGLADGGGLGIELTEDEMLSDIWSQEPDIRAETETWLYSYLAMAYAPLSDQDIATYTAFSETRGGQVLNRALFEAFDVVYRRISRQLGLTAARFAAGEDI